MTTNDIEQLLPECLLRSETYSLVITDLEGRYIYVNDVFKNRFSFICENFIGQPFFIAIYPEDHDKCLKALEQVFQNPDKVVKVNLRKPDNHLNDFYWTEWEFSLFKNKDKNPVGILCLGHDITETEKLSKQAKAFAQKVDTIIEEITDGFYVLNREWEFIKTNKTAEQILGVPREKLLGRKIWDLFPDTPDYNYPAQFRKAMNEYVTVSFEDYLADLDRWFSIVCYPSQEGLTVFFKDITQEKKTQLSLEDTSNKLKSILESMLNGYILINPQGKIMDFNQTAQNLALQYAEKNLVINTDMREYLSEYNKEIFDKFFHKALQGEKNIVEVARMIGGKETWLEVHYLPVYKEKKQELIGVTLKIVDISDRKQAENKLKQSEYMLRAIYQSTTEASTFIDRDFIIRYNNQAAKDVTKQVFGREAQIGENSLDCFLPQYQEEFRNYYEKVLLGESFVLERTDGTNWWRISLFPVYDKEQNIIGIANNVQDISDRKQKEILLEETKTRLDSTIEAIPHPLLIVSENNLITYVNTEFESVLGYSAQEVIGREIDFLLPERYRAGHKFLQQQYLQKGGAVKKTGRYVQALTKSGTEIVIDASLNTFVASGKKYVIVILQDVTEQKKHQDTIIQQNETLRQIAWQQSHELRGPVANILGLCELLKNYQDETEEMKHKCIDYMLQATKELDKIIHKIVLQANESEYNE